MKTTFLRSLLITCAAFFMCSCDDVFQKIAKSLGEKNCTDKALIQAGSDKRTLLFAKNHIYVVGKDGKYDPNMKTENPYSGAKWKNSDIVNFRYQQISDFFPTVNNILRDTGSNIYVYHSGYDIRVVTQDKIQAHLHQMLGATGATRDLVDDVVKEDPNQIHVLWLWTSSSSAMAVGVVAGRYIAVGDDPISGNKLNNMQFSHEFGHVLGFDTHVFNDPSNLMNDDSIGTKLNSQQLQTIWSSLNDPRDKLYKLTCDK